MLETGAVDGPGVFDLFVRPTELSLTPGAPTLPLDGIELVVVVEVTLPLTGAALVIAVEIGTWELLRGSCGVEELLAVLDLWVCKVVGLDNAHWTTPVC